MLTIELHKHDTNGDPPARFATDAEIQVADQLRHELEERYLGSSTASAPLQARIGADAAGSIHGESTGPVQRTW